MKINPISLVIGVAIGAIALSAPMVFLLTSQPKDTNEIQMSFFVEGYLKDLSDDKLIIHQNLRPDWREAEDSPELDIHIGLNRGAALHNCGNAPSNAKSECVGLFRNGSVPAGTGVCAHVRLIDGQFYGGKIFFGNTCELPPRI